MVDFNSSAKLMTKNWTIFLGVLGAGMAQFGILAGAGANDPLVLIAGTIGAMGTALLGLLKQLPRDEWSDKQRKEQE